MKDHNEVIDTGVAAESSKTSMQTIMSLQDEIRENRFAQQDRHSTGASPLSDSFNFPRRHDEYAEYELPDNALLPNFMYARRLTDGESFYDGEDINCVPAMRGFEFWSTECAQSFY